MKTLATSTAAIALALSLSGTALANATRVDSSAKHAKHPLRHHRPTHKHTGIGPGGDQDSDNHGAPSDGDGNF